MSVNPSRKHLVLLGAGRANLHALRRLARQGHGGAEVSLVAPQPWYIEPALLACQVAGDCALDDIRRPLQPLLDASGASLVSAQVLSLDPQTRRVQLSSGDALAYDVLSIDVEPTLERDHVEQHLPGARRNAMFVHPLETFVQLWPQLRQLATEQPLHIAVIGANVLAVELALAMAGAVQAPHGSRVTLVTDGQDLLQALPATLRRRVEQRLRQLNVTVLPERCVGVTDRAVLLASGAELLCGAPIVATQPAAPDWLRTSGLHTDEAGQLVINARRQSDSHRQVFVAAPQSEPESAAVLADNLLVALNGGNLRAVPQPAQRLAMLLAGTQHAIAAWGPLALQGREVWHWKTRRDLRQLARLLD